MLNFHPIDSLEEASWLTQETRPTLLIVFVSSRISPEALLQPCDTSGETLEDPRNFCDPTESVRLGLGPYVTTTCTVSPFPESANIR